MDIKLLFPRCKRLCRADQLGDPCFHCLLVFPDLRLLKQILGNQLHFGGIRIKTVLKAHGIKNLRAVQTQLEKDVPQYPVFQPCNQE